MSDAAPDRPPAKLWEVALLFLRLGFTAFGGPAAHIAIMEVELVRRRRWLSSERFLDLLGTANLLPGPSSTELAIFIGYEECGWLGLVLAGLCFILPAAMMVTALAWAYIHFGSLPRVAGILYGIKPVVIAVVVQALWSLAPRAIKGSTRLLAVGLAAGIASALGADALLVLIGGGMASAIVGPPARLRSMNPGVLALLLGGRTSAAVPLGLVPLFLVFLKTGAVVFGSGYVLLAFLHADLVDRLHWITEQQLLDAVAIGQVTPGPVFTTATFIGYVVAARAGASGILGAAVATVGIFLPGFVLVAFTRPLVARIRRSALAGAFLDGVNVAALALMAVVAAELVRAALVDAWAIGIAIASVVALVRFRVSTTWLVGGGAVLGAVVGSSG